MCSIALGHQNLFQCAFRLDDYGDSVLFSRSANMKIINWDAELRGDQNESVAPSFWIWMCFRVIRGYLLNSEDHFVENLDRHPIPQSRQLKTFVPIKTFPITPHQTFIIEKTLLFSKLFYIIKKKLIFYKNGTNYNFITFPWNFIWLLEFKKLSFCKI